MPTEYNAWGWTAGAGLEGLQLIRKTLPQPGANEVLIANTAIALNPVDWKIIEWGHADWHTGRVPGVDGVGVVVAAGSAVTLKIGTRVAYHQSLSRDGSFAEYCLLDANAALPVPESLDDAVAASLPCPGLTALQALDKVPVVGARDVLVVGAGGAVGSLLVQLAVQRGLRVWATASAQHHARLLAQGAVGVFDYRADTWQTELQSRLGSVACMRCSIPSAGLRRAAWQHCWVTTGTWCVFRIVRRQRHCRRSAPRSHSMRWPSTVFTLTAAGPTGNSYVSTPSN